MPRPSTQSVALVAPLGAVLAAGLAIGRGEAEQPTPGRYAVAAGTNFGLVIDQASGQVWRCGPIDVQCDRLRLEAQ
jgi:hypothetical protein